MYFSCQIPPPSAPPPAFNISGETDSLPCMLITEAGQSGEVEVAQNFSERN